MTTKFFDELTSFITGDLYIGEDESYLDIELYHNTYLISASVEERAAISIEDFEEFFRSVIENRRQQLQASSIRHNMVFYVWHDEKAGQLRFSINSDLYDKLPFGATLNIVSDIRPIIGRFLGDKPFIGWDEMVIEEYTGQSYEEPELEHVLDVYVVKLEADYARSNS